MRSRVLVFLCLFVEVSVCVCVCFYSCKNVRVYVNVLASQLRFEWKSSNPLRMFVLLMSASRRHQRRFIFS